MSNNQNNQPVTPETAMIKLDQIRKALETCKEKVAVYINMLEDVDVNTPAGDVLYEAKKFWDGQVRRLSNLIKHWEEFLGIEETKWISVAGLTRYAFSEN